MPWLVFGHWGRLTDTHTHTPFSPLYTHPNTCQQYRSSSPQTPKRPSCARRPCPSPSTSSRAWEPWGYGTSSCYTRIRWRAAPSIPLTPHSSSHTHAHSDNKIQPPIPTHSFLNPPLMHTLTHQPHSITPRESPLADPHRFLASVDEISDDSTPQNGATYLLSPLAEEEGGEQGRAVSPLLLGVLRVHALAKTRVQMVSECVRVCVRVCIGVWAIVVGASAAA